MGESVVKVYGKDVANIYLNIYLIYPKWKVGLAKNIYLDKTRNPSFIY